MAFCFINYFDRLDEVKHVWMGDLSVAQLPHSSREESGLLSANATTVAFEKAAIRFKPRLGEIFVLKDL